MMDPAVQVGHPPGPRSSAAPQGARNAARARGRQCISGRPPNLSRGCTPLSHHASTVPAPASASFAELGVPAPLVASLATGGITTPFPIQSATLPDSLAGRDVLGRGRTGSGKTYAFVLPMLARLAASRKPAVPGRPRALILAPTRELASQID